MPVLQFFMIRHCFRVFTVTSVLTPHIVFHTMNSVRYCGLLCVKALPNYRTKLAIKKNRHFVPNGDLKSER